MAHAFLAIILAAGEGTRMKSNKPKVLHEVAGLSMVGHVIHAVKHAGAPRIALVVGNEAETVTQVTQTIDPKLEIYQQKTRQGTAHAVLAARAAIAKADDYLIVACGDTPLVTSGLFESIVTTLEDGADVAVLGFETANPTGYGRLITEGGKLLAIREENEANDEERTITFCNSGIIGFQTKHALKLLDAIGNDNAKGEYYLTDAIAIARSEALDVRAVKGEQEDTLGVNNRVELAQAEAIYQDRLRQKFMLAGVTLIDPQSVYFSFDTQIGQDSIIEPNCYIAPGVVLADNVHIKANSYLEGGRGKKQKVSVASKAQIGPFARLRPGADIGINAKVGNFCEVKNASVAEDAKINHLTYIGDAELGKGVNIGAGTITCNYDGFSKFKTIIKDGAFVGSNSSLVAPVTIESGAYIGSGSVITKNVSPDALAIARGRQQEVARWAATFREKNQK